MPRSPGAGPPRAQKIGHHAGQPRLRTCPAAAGGGNPWRAVADVGVALVEQRFEANSADTAAPVRPRGIDFGRGTLGLWLRRSLAGSARPEREGAARRDARGWTSGREALDFGPGVDFRGAGMGRDMGQIRGPGEGDRRSIAVPARPRLEHRTSLARSLSADHHRSATYLCALYFQKTSNLRRRLAKRRDTLRRGKNSPSAPPLSKRTENR